MSLFKWVIDTIIGGSPQARPGDKCSRSSVTGMPASAVATLNPPADSLGMAPDETPAWFIPDDASCTDPVPLPAPAGSGGLQALENMLFNKLDGGDLDLPPMPRVAQLALKELRGRDCDLRKVAEIISNDQATATRVLRAVNGAIWGSLKITSLPQAAVRLGIKPLTTIMMSESLRSVTLAAKKCNPELAQAVWQRALAGAAIMHALAPLAAMDEDEAFVIGLLHDIGNVIVLRVTAAFEVLSRSRVDCDAFDYVCRQYHQEFGELIADEWDLPPRVKELIKSHHDYPADDDPLRSERLLLILSDMISRMLGYDTPASYRLLESRPVRDLNLADRREFIQLLRRLPEEVEQQLLSL